MDIEINKDAIAAVNATISAANVSTVSETQATQNADVRLDAINRHFANEMIMPEQQYKQIKLPLAPMRPIDAQEIRYAVEAYVRYYPNCHQEDIVPRQDLRSAFAYLRNHLNLGANYMQAAGDLEALARSYRNM